MMIKSHDYVLKGLLDAQCLTWADLFFSDVAVEEEDGYQRNLLTDGDSSDYCQSNSVCFLCTRLPTSLYQSKGRLTLGCGADAHARDSTGICLLFG